MRTVAQAFPIAATLLSLALVADGRPKDKVEALEPVLDQVRSELDLTDEQVGRLEGVLGDQVDRARVAVDGFGGLSFDSVVDLLAEARDMKKDLEKELGGFLSDEQKAKLKGLPASKQIYREAIAVAITEARLGKLEKELELTADQRGPAREALLDGIREATDIVEGVVDKEKGSKRSVMDALLDLRATERSTNRRLERVLTDEQKERLERYRQESRKASRSKG